MGTPSKGGTQEKNFIPEGDLYRLIARSKLPAAERFERWVFDDVLPTIRAYGGYGIAEQINKFPIPKTFPEALRLAADLQEKNETLESKIEEDKPKVNFANSLLDTKTCIPALDLSKILYQNGVDIGQHRLYTWLRENGYFIKKGDSKNLPTHKAMKLGLFKISEKAWFNKATQQAEISRKTLVTPKGQMYFINKFISGKAKYTT